MDPHDAHRRFERLLADALLSKDPVEALDGAADAGEILEALGIVRSAIDPDGLRLTGLLVAKLRFERLLRASPEAGKRFEADPREFTRAFR